MNEKATALLRNTRNILHTIAEPVDWGVRMLNNKRGYPPLRLRQLVGDLDNFEGSGGEYIAYLKLLCNLKKGHRLLDIGCGCSLLLLDTTGAGSLAEYLGKEGIYVGMDIDLEPVTWNKKHITNKYPNCWFLHTTEKADKFKFLFEDETFDVIVAKSLFTHLLPKETTNHLSEIGRLLKPRGKCLSTWFLLRMQELKGKYTFPYRHRDLAFQRETKPELAVAYEEKWLVNTMTQLGFYITEKRYGTWSDGNNGLSFQDILVLESRK